MIGTKGAGSASGARRPQEAPGAGGGRIAPKAGRMGKVAVPSRKRAVLEVYHDLADAGGGWPWRIRLRVVRRILLLHEQGDGPPIRYRYRSGAMKAARDLAGELGLDPWRDVEVTSEL